MPFKAAGAPCDLFRENVLLNPSSFASSNGTDDWRQSAHGLASPTRNLVRDATAYSTEPVSSNWGTKGKQGLVSSHPTNGDGTSGSLT